MSAHLSAWGIFHTTVSVLPIGFGAYALARYHRVDLRKWSGQLYLATMLVGTLTAFGLSKAGGWDFGHVLSLVTLGFLVSGMLAEYGQVFGKLSKAAGAISLSGSYFMLMLFTTTETLTRLPVGKPIASGPEAPLLVAIHLTLLLSLAAGATWQYYKLRGTVTAKPVMEAWSSTSVRALSS